MQRLGPVVKASAKGRRLAQAHPEALVRLGARRRNLRCVQASALYMACTTTLGDDLWGAPYKSAESSTFPVR